MNRVCAYGLILLALTGCGTLKLEGQVLYPEQATATRIAALAAGYATPTPSAHNLSPVTFPTPQHCEIAFYWGTMPGLCPEATPAQVDAAFQVYDNGYMLWEQATGSVYILYNGGIGRRIEPSIISDWPEVQVQTTPPPNHVYPVRGFGRVWQHEKDVNDAIGWPLGLEQAYTAEFQSAGADSASQYYYISLPNGQVVEFSHAGTWRVVK